MCAIPSGEQWTIEFGDQHATIVEVGGGLRTFSAGGADLVAGYAADEQCAQGRGQVLMPWPNRIRDGRYEFGGGAHQLALTEPARGNASHGLVRWALWTLLERSPSSLTVGYRLHPQPGWAWRLDLSVTYRLSPGGLAVEMQARNVGSGDAPFGCGAHPYVALGDTPLGAIELTIPAAERVVVDPDRKLPKGAAPVEEGGLDFRTARRLAGIDLDTAFTGLQIAGDGRWRVEVGGLQGGSGSVAVWGNAAFPWVQVFTDHARDEGAQGPRGIAVEPLTCPPDAFNSGTGLVVLEPGARWSGEWGISVE